MKYQVFFLSLLCFISSSAMEKRPGKSLENSAQVANALVRYANALLMFNPEVDRENLARNIDAVRQCPLTDRKRNKALLLIMDEHMELIRMNRHAWAEQENWREQDYGSSTRPTEKRRKIN